MHTLTISAWAAGCHHAAPGHARAATWGSQPQRQWQQAAAARTSPRTARILVVNLTRVLPLYWAGATHLLLNLQEAMAAFSRFKALAQSARPPPWCWHRAASRPGQTASQASCSAGWSWAWEQSPSHMRLLNLPATSVNHMLQTQGHPVAFRQYGECSMCAARAANGRRNGISSIRTHS